MSESNLDLIMSEYADNVRRLQKETNWSAVIELVRSVRLGIRSNQTFHNEVKVRFEVQLLQDEAVAYEMLGNLNKAIRIMQNLVRISTQITLSEIEIHGYYIWLAGLLERNGDLDGAHLTICRSLSFVLSPVATECVASTLDDLANYEQLHGEAGTVSYLHNLAGILRRERKYRPSIDRRKSEGSVLAPINGPHDERRA